MCFRLCAFGRILKCSSDAAIFCFLLRAEVSGSHLKRLLLLLFHRWGVIGWLLTLPQTVAGQSAARMALLFDWLTFQPASESVMNIEPAMLLMVRTSS